MTRMYANEEEEKKLLWNHTMSYAKRKQSDALRWTGTSIAFLYNVMHSAWNAAQKKRQRVPIFSSVWFSFGKIRGEKWLIEYDVASQEEWHMRNTNGSVAATMTVAAVALFVLNTNDVEKHSLFFRFKVKGALWLLFIFQNSIFHKDIAYYGD